MSQHDPNAPQPHDIDESQPRRDGGPWHPHHGPLMKTLSWIILLAFAVVILIMIAVIIYEAVG